MLVGPATVIPEDLEDFVYVLQSFAERLACVEGLQRSYGLMLRLDEIRQLQEQFPPLGSIQRLPRSVEESFLSSGNSSVDIFRGSFRNGDEFFLCAVLPVSPGYKQKQKQKQNNREDSRWVYVGKFLVVLGFNKFIVDKEASVDCDLNAIGGFQGDCRRSHFRRVRQVSVISK